MLVLLAVAGALCIDHNALAKTISLGGDEDRVRVVFSMDYDHVPAISRDNQTLIVKFPDKIGNPTRLGSFALIQGVQFDGQEARISVSGPFTHTAFSLRNPHRYVIDILAESKTSSFCPIEDLSVYLGQGTTRLVFRIQDGMWPKVLQADRKIFLVFNGEVQCEQLDRRIGRIPQLERQDAIRMEDGTALVLTAVESDFELELFELRHEIVLTTGLGEGGDRGTLAREAYAQGELAGCIRILDSHPESLTAEEQVLLGRCYWKTSYPYGEEARIEEALLHMSRGIETLSVGREREEVMLEYVDMLLRAGQLAEALKYIRYLKDSAIDEVAEHAMVAEIDYLNRKELFEDAFVAQKRLLNEFGEGGLPAEVQAYYQVIAGDTYLGLNAYDKALARYEAALERDPVLLQKDPTLYARLADATFKGDDYPRAKEYLLQVINLGVPEDRAGYLVKLGDCLYHLGQVDQAIQVFSEVENLAPRTDSGVVAKLRRARILMEEDLRLHDRLSDKIYYEILDIYETISIAPEDAQGPLDAIVKLRKAQTYARHGDWNEAFSAYYRAWLDTKKDNPIHAYAQAEAEKGILRRIKELSAGQQHAQIVELYSLYQESFLLEIQDPEILFVIGEALHALEQDGTSRRLLLECEQRMSPWRAPALSLLFEIDYAQGRLAAAQAWNAAYLQDYADGEKAGRMKEARGELLYKLGRCGEAVPFLEMIAAIGDERALANLDILVNCYHRLGNVQAEGETLERIIALGRQANSPIIERALYRRGKMLWQEGQPQHAQALFQALMEAYPASECRWWSLYHLAQIALQEGRVPQGEQMLNEVLQGSRDQMLVSAVRGALGGLRVQESLTQFREIKNRFGEQ